MAAVMPPLKTKGSASGGSQLSSLSSPPPATWGGGRGEGERENGKQEGKEGMEVHGEGEGEMKDGRRHG